jgi:hypothetical protein
MTHNHPANRQYLLATATKLFCRECGALRQVTDYFAGGTNEAKLDCGHRRKIEAQR